MATNISVYVRDIYDEPHLHMMVQGDIYSSKSFDVFNKFNTNYGAPDIKVVTDRIDNLASYHRPELTIYSAIARQARKQNLLPDVYESMQNTIDYMYSIITRTPILIERRNGNSIISALANIGAIAMCLGKINEFIPFMHNVIDNHLYVAESSLAEYNGRRFIEERKFVLPDSVDPYKTPTEKDVILSEVYEKINARITETYFTYLITESMNRDPFYIEEQLKCRSISHRRAFIYATRLFPTITSFVSWYWDKFPNLSASGVISNIFYNDSVIGGAGNFRYLEKDADWFNAMIDKKNVAMFGHLDALANVVVHDINFFLKLHDAIPIEDFYVAEDTLETTSSQEITALMLSKKSLPRSMMKISVLSKVDIPAQFFVNNIERLYLNTSHGNRKHFESKYTLAEITALLK